ncbi:unnamed protein product [Closterium sp. NIES-65]|nr:unnamed protein product [Closterium sp. NIES-65]
MADKHSYGVVRKFIGHGVGSVFHAGPAVLHYREIAPPAPSSPPLSLFSLSHPHPHLFIGHAVGSIFHAGPAVLDYREFSPAVLDYREFSPAVLDYREFSPAVLDYREFSPAVLDYREFSPAVLDYREFSPAVLDYREFSPAVLDYREFSPAVLDYREFSPAVLDYREFSPLTLLSPPPATNLPGTLPYSPPLKPLIHLFIGPEGPPWPHSSHQSPSQPPSFTSTGIGLTLVLHSPDKSCFPHLFLPPIPPSFPSLFPCNNEPGRMQVGQTFTIEPMFTMGGVRDVMWDDGWTAVTADGTLTTQFEHTLLITETGVEVLTR